MIRRDYIMKLVQQLLDSLFLLLNEKGLDEIGQQKLLEEFYKDYLGEDREYYNSNELDVIIAIFKSKYGDELMQRLEMLSEIMYQDAMLEQEIHLKGNLLRKTLSLLLYLNENGDTYSIVRQGKVESIRKELQFLEN